MTTHPDTLPDDIDALKAALAAERTARLAAEAAASSAEALIAHLRLAIEKMKRELYGSRSERGRKLLDQMELELEELEATAAEDEAAAELAAGDDATTTVPAHARRRSVRQKPPDHLPRERGVIGNSVERN